MGGGLNSLLGVLRLLELVSGLLARLGLALSKQLLRTQPRGGLVSGTG